MAVLSYESWQSRFNGDSKAIGQTINLNSHPFEIVGVVRAGFHGLDVGARPDVYVPITMEPQLAPEWLKLDDRRFRWVQIFARLRDGMSAGQAEAGLQGLYHALLEREASESAFATASSDTKRKFLEGRLHITPARTGHSALRESVTKALLILMAIATGVLLIVCANVANLLIARSAARYRELALRVGIGATRWQTIRLLLVECGVLAVLGTAVGLLLARWGAEALLRFYSDPDTPMSISPAPDLRIVAFTSLVAIVTVLLAGCVPALRGTRVDLAPALRNAGGAVVTEEPKLRKTLVVVQVALSFVLLIGAGLFVRSLQKLLDVDTGFRTSQLLSFSIDLAPSGYTPARAHDFAKAMQERIAESPGVESAAYAFMGVLEGSGWGMGFTVEGYHPKDGQGAGAMCNAVSPGFFQTMGATLLAGRDFDDRDDRVPSSAKKGWPFRTGIVNEAFVKRYFSGHNPIGRHIGIGEDPGTAMPIEIVGVAKDTHYMSVREDLRPQVFVPALQSNIERLTFYVRSAGEPGQMMAALRRTVASLEASLPTYNVSSMEQRVARSTANERLIASLSGVLSGMATLLAVIGLYGVMAYTVTRRTREIGIRMALGAMGSQVAGRILSEAGTLVGVGLLLGWAAAASLGRFVGSQLYGVKPADALTIVMAGLLLSAIAAVAALLPAYRAASISTMAALRDE